MLVYHNLVVDVMGIGRNYFYQNVDNFYSYPHKKQSYPQPKHRFLWITSLIPGILLLVGIVILHNRYLLRNDYPLWSPKEK